MASPDELWLVDFGDPFPGEPAFRRPALVVGPPAEYGAALPFVFVVPGTTTRRGISLHVEVEPSAANALESTTYLQCELLRSVAARRLVARLGHADAATATQVEQILRSLLRLW